MSAYTDPNMDEIVKIDVNHAQLVTALVMSQKPGRVLELGFGSGEATRAILAGLRYNGAGCEYTIVDNWLDFDGIQPAITQDPEYAGINFVTSPENVFVSEALHAQNQYDFIFSDADHMATQNWFEPVYQQLLARAGILIYHDVTNTRDFPNLLRIYHDCVRNGYHYALFNNNSRTDERCDRGLLAIFKH